GHDGRRGARGAEQVVAFGGGEQQRPGERADHLRRRVRGAGLLGAPAVLHGDARERGGPLAAQAGGAARTGSWQTHIGGLQVGATGAQERREIGPVRHVPSVLARGGRRVVPVIPRTSGPPQRPDALEPWWA